MHAKPGFRSDVQGLRALAVVAVVAYHAGHLPGGFTGVDVFFVISGFVIGRLLLRELSTTGRVDLRRFYARRARRLLPALAVMLTVVTALSSQLVGYATQAQTLSTARAAALFHANLHLARLPGAGYFDPAVERNPLLHTWSLSIEEQFYFVLPVLLVVSWAVGRRLSPAGGRRVSLSMLLAVLAGSLLLSWAQTRQIPGAAGLSSMSAAFFSPLTRAWEFVVGVLVAAVEPRLSRLRSRTATSLSVLGWVGVLSAFTLLDASWPFPGLVALWPVAATAALLAAGTATAKSRFPADRLLRSTPAVHLGDWSYSWYLWHWPLIVFAENLFPLDQPQAATAAATLSLVPAWLSFRLVEQPLRRSARSAEVVVRARPSLVTALIVVTGLAVPVITVGIAQAELPAKQEAWQELAAPFRYHDDYLGGCDEVGRRIGDPVSALPVEECIWPHSGATLGVAMLVGDSHAGHLTEAFVAAAHSLSLDAVVRTRSACAAVPAVLLSEGRRDERCGEYYRRLLVEVKQLDAAVVVVAASHAGYFSDEFAFEVDGLSLSSRQQKLDWWPEALAATVHELSQAGASVVLALPTPRFEAGWRPAELAPWRLTRPPETFAPTISREKAEATARDSRQAVLEAARRSDAYTLDLWDTLCPGPVCSAQADGMWLYRDAHHLSVGAADILAHPVGEALARALGAAGP